MEEIKADIVNPVPKIYDTGDSTKKPQEPNYTDKEHENKGQSSDSSKSSEDLYTNSGVYNNKGENLSDTVGQKVDQKA